MLKNAHYHEDAGFEPTPNYATEAELVLADELRHQLEVRYFGSSASTTRLPPPADEVH
jgi:hypothetical protein